MEDKKVLHNSSGDCKGTISLSTKKKHSHMSGVTKNLT